MEMFSSLYKMKCTALRFANVYGPGATGKGAYATAVASWCQSLKNVDPLRKDGDGFQTRDLVYVDDVVSALCFITDEPRFVQLPGFWAFNVGTETSISNNDILEKLRTEVGNFETYCVPERSGDAKHTLLSIGMLRSFGWEPKVSFDEGLQRTLEWWRLK